MLAPLLSGRTRAAAVRALLRRSAHDAAPPVLRFAPDGVTACAPAAAPGEFAVYAAPQALLRLGSVAFVDLPEVDAQLLQGAKACMTTCAHRGTPCRTVAHRDAPSRACAGRHCGMLESATKRQVLLAAPLTGEVTRRNEALLASPPPPAPAAGQPLWLLDVLVADAAEWNALPRAPPG
jgi:glycine cleavage system H lipoate-binding protein